jgi:putative NADPH-quinone reductase
MKNILVILGHPETDSFCGALADSFSKGAEQNGRKVDRLNLGDMDFTPVLRKGMEMEQCLKDAQQKIQDADHIAFIYPNWWGLMPALMKGFIDRVFLEGFAFEFSESSPLPKGLLKGKTAQLLVTMDTPPWYYKMVYKMPGHRAMQKSILDFCGVRTVKTTEFAVMKKSTPEMRSIWLKKAAGLGATS